MGLRGPPPKPTALKILEGNPGRRPLNGEEPQPPQAKVKLKVPRHLSDHAKRAWKTYYPMLRRMRVLTRADLMGLEALCEAWADLQVARAALAEAGRYQSVRTKSGDVMKRLHPAVGDAQDADRRLRGWLAEFGLTPAQRSRVVALPINRPNDFDEDVDDMTDEEKRIAWTRGRPA